MKRRTKIVCTLGPAVDSESKIIQLIKAGMNVARINCSHGDWDTRCRWVEWIRKHSPDVGPVAILADLQGPKFRLGVLDPNPMEVKAGQSLTIGPTGTVPLHQEEILATMAPGRRLLLGDGDLEIRLGKRVGADFEGRTLTAGTIKTKQGVTLVGQAFATNCLTPKDLIDVEEAAKASVDIIALSYVHKAQDMTELRHLVDQYDKTIRLCAKVETRQAVKNIVDIVRVSDVVMVARGDLGLQMDIEDVPIAQKVIIRECREQGKPVITATQMLESMINAPRPTRAEATDVANAILDGSDAVMLSGETASGAYPIKAVEYMAKIARKAEAAFDYKGWLKTSTPEPHEETVAVAYAVAQLASLIHPKAILTTSTSGQTARLVSKFRPRVPIYCATWSHRTHCALGVVWGVDAIHMGMPSSTDEQISNAISRFAERKRIKTGDNVIVSAGVPAGLPGNTNLIMLQKVS